MNVVSIEQATQEINNWLDLKKVRAKKREDYKEIIESLVGAMMEGDLTIDDKGLMTQNLSFPIGESGISSVTYALRASVDEVSTWTKGVPAGNGEARILAVASGLTSKAGVKDVAKTTLGKMDSTDGSLLQSIIVFFM